MSDVITRRADVDAKQAILGRILDELACEAAILLVPAHVAWFTCGMNLRGLYTESERPGLFVNGKMRWLVCCNVDTQRLFDEELDGLGFMVKEWAWPSGRAQLLAELAVNKKMASDRPFPNMPLMVDRLRNEARPLFPSDRPRLGLLGENLAHALEATARTLKPGDTEAEVAGQLAHRLYARGADVQSISVTADDRATLYRRAGYQAVRIERFALLQVSAMDRGLHATAGRMVSFGEPPAELREAIDAACRISAVFRANSKPGGNITAAIEAGYKLVKATPLEFDWRHSAPGYGSGWFPAEDLRRVGVDDPFVDGQTLVWQARLGAAAVVDTVVVHANGGLNVTRPGDWPQKRITIDGKTYAIPDVLVRTESAD